MKTTAERQREFHRKKLAEGFKRVAVYVPEKDVKKLQEYAKKLAQ